MYSRAPNRWPLRVPVACFGYRSWLTSRMSLTQRLRERCEHFSVREVKQRLVLPRLDEATAAKIAPHRTALIREVFLYCGEQAVVYARSILPRESLVGAWARLGRLGTRPLGHALFSDPRVQRQPFRFRKFRSGDVIHRAATRGKNIRRELWGRYSVFHLHGRPIMVTEVFLPAILDLPR